MVKELSRETAQAKKGEMLAYIPAIDGLRAVAVLMVLCHHFLPATISSVLGFGGAGVEIFFVISGFLITGILLNYQKQATVAKGLKTFYMRRVFRIFPLYYFYLGLVAFFAGLSKSDALYSIFYAQNFNVIRNGWTNHLIPHLWSLSVEEQFYLIWPLAVLITPKRYQKAMIIGTVAFGFAFNLITGTVEAESMTSRIHLFSCIQSLAAGGFLALIYRRRPAALRAFGRHCGKLFAFVAGLWIAVTVLGMIYQWVSVFLRPINAAIACVLIVDLIRQKRVDENASPFARAMSTPALRWIGQISYGIYVYHILVKAVLEPHILRFIGEGSWLYSNNYVLTFPLYTVITICVSYLSFRFFESPINRLKNRFSIA